ncbi:MAG: hypothetical protein IKF19_01995 [Bacilli bacterium]|nr:hypothetical protein [Bacilli bacterium]
MDNNKSNEVNNMNYNVSYKKLVLIFGITLFIILALAILFYININKDTSKVVKGSIKYVGDDYIILTDEDSDKEYLIDIDDIGVNEKCEVGDELSLTIDKIKNDKDPIEAEAREAKIISKAKKDEIVVNEVHEETKDNYNVIKSDEETFNNSSNNNPSVNNEITSSSSPSMRQQSDNSVVSEEDVVSYFNSLNVELDNSSNNKTLSESAKNGFVTVVDFLFYDGSIKGRTFKDLSNVTKLKVLRLGIAIDKKIDNYFPDYKSTLSSKYQNVKSLAISKYLDKTAEVCNKNESACQSARDGLAELKNNFSITWSFIKDISGVGLSKLKSWYEVWRQA